MQISNECTLNIRFVLASLAVCAIALVGCTRVGQRVKRPTDSMTIEQQWEPHSLNPALENGDSSQEWGLLLFSYLVRYGPKGHLIPDVATAVPTLRNGGISKDGLTITYHLRRGVRFADGTALTAADAAWSIDAINNPNNDVQSRFGYDDVASARAVTPYTLVLHLKSPFAPLVSVVLAPQGFPILPKHLLARYPNFNAIGFNLAPIGSGPYMVKRWVHGDRVVLSRNPYYWKAVPPIARLTIVFVSDAQAAIDLLLTHEAQGYYDDRDPRQYPVLAALVGYRVTRATPPDDGVGAIIFNTQDTVVADSRVRHALAEAIDIKTMIARTYRGGERSFEAGRGLFMWAYDPSAYPDIPYDPVHARALLHAAGWLRHSDGYRYKNGRRLNILFIIQAGTPADAIIGAQVIQYERAVGAKITLKAFNVTQFVAPPNQGGPVYGGHFQMALYPFENGADPDTTDQFDCANVPPSGFNKSRICNAQLDALLRAGRTVYDAARRKIIYERLERLLYQQMPIALLYRTRQINTWTTRLHAKDGAAPGPWNVATWSLTP